MKGQSSPLIFDTIVLRFTRQIHYANENAFQLEIRRSPPPLSGGAFEVNIADQLQQLQDLFSQNLTNGQFFSRFQIPTMTDTMIEDLSTIGQRLYALLPLAFQQTFPRLVQKIFEKGHGLSLILEARAGDKADRLLGLPWELLFFESTGVFLARSPRVLVTRRLVDAVRRSPLEMTPPFNIVHVIAHAPINPQKYQIDATLREMEQQRIPAATQPGVYSLVTEPGSIEQLLSVLQEQAYHILHFLGHGEVLKSATDIKTTERSYLRFLDAAYESQWINGEQLQHLLEFTPTVQLVVLNACHGGANVARSVALELIYHGLPYVVAIQGDILQEAARYFIETFYAELQRGNDVAYAVAAGRAGIAAHLPQTWDWCLPVLYTNVGLDEPSSDIQNAERLWRWMSAPTALRRLGMVNLVLGVPHLLVGLLLLISQKTVPLPFSVFINWPAALMMFLPLLTAMVFYWRTPPKALEHWSLSTKLLLLVRVLGATSIAGGVSSFYTWLVWLWFIAVGFWKTLSPAAQILLLGAIFIPGAILEWKLSRSQAHGHARSFISETQITLPIFEWSQITLILGGYGLRMLPWALYIFCSQYIQPPWGNLWVGILLLMLWYASWKEENDN